METIAIILAASFVALAALHLYWALGGRFGISAALPEVNGAPLFIPGMAATVAVAFVLAGFASVALALGLGAGSAVAPVFPFAVYLGFAIAAVLILRALGEFRYVGWFKRVKGSRFAVYDTWLFSPFCLLAGVAFLALALARL